MNGKYHCNLLEWFIFIQYRNTFHAIIPCFMRRANITFTGESAEKELFSILLLVHEPEKMKVYFEQFEDDIDKIARKIWLKVEYLSLTHSSTLSIILSSLTWLCMYKGPMTIAKQNISAMRVHHTLLCPDTVSIGKLGKVNCDDDDKGNSETWHKYWDKWVSLLGPLPGKQVVTFNKRMNDRKRKDYILLRETSIRSGDDLSYPFENSICQQAYFLLFHRCFFFHLFCFISFSTSLLLHRLLLHSIYGFCIGFNETCSHRHIPIWRNTPGPARRGTAETGKSIVSDGSDSEWG